MKRKSIPRSVLQFIKKNSGIKLDIGCGDHKQKGFMGMDFRKTKNSDLVWNCENVPYPIPDAVCTTILCSHLIEHLKPWLIIDIINEWWRISKVGGQLWLSTPYAGSFGFWQDPTHTKPWNEATAEYFDPSKFLFNIYKPKPWKIIKNDWYQQGNLEIILEKRPENHNIETPGGYDLVDGEIKKDDKKKGKK